MFFGLSLIFNVVFTSGQIHLRQTVETLPLETSSVTKLGNIFLLIKFKLTILQNVCTIESLQNYHQ